MTTEKQRLKKMAEAKRAARRQANQVRLTLEIAESRKDFADRWEQLRAYAGKVARTYCGKRLGTSNPDLLDDIRDESLSEAWRYVCNGDEPEHAIRKAVSLIVSDGVRIARQSRTLPDLESKEQSPAEDWAVLDIVTSLPTNLGQLAYAMSTGIESNYELAERLGCSEGTIRNRRKELRKLLSDRYQLTSRHDFLAWLKDTFTHSDAI